MRPAGRPAGRSADRSGGRSGGRAAGGRTGGGRAAICCLKWFVHDCYFQHQQVYTARMK